VRRFLCPMTWLSRASSGRERSAGFQPRAQLARQYFDGQSTQTNGVSTGHGIGVMRNNSSSTKYANFRTRLQRKHHRDLAVVRRSRNGGPCATVRHAGLQPRQSDASGFRKGLMVLPQNLTITLLACKKRSCMLFCMNQPATPYLRYSSLAHQ
jgi:hypothetical protein